MRGLSNSTTCAVDGARTPPAAAPGSPRPAGRRTRARTRRPGGAGGASAQPLGGVEHRVAGVQHVPRAVVDVDQQRVERPAAPPARTPAGPRSREEVGRDQPGARVGGEPGRHPAAAAARASRRPRASASTTTSERDPRVLERGDRGVAQPEPADERRRARSPRQRGEPEPGQLDLGDREQAGHEELVAELDLEDVDVAACGSRRRRRLISPIGVSRQSSSSNRALIAPVRPPLRSAPAWSAAYVVSLAGRPGAGALGADPGGDHEADAEHRPQPRHLVQHDQADHQRDRRLQAHQGAERRGGEPAQRQHLQAERDDRQQDRQARARRAATSQVIDGHVRRAGDQRSRPARRPAARRPARAGRRPRRRRAG